MDRTPGLWTRDNLNQPHELQDKAYRVRQMFDAIAPSYDLNNRLHSLWLDQAWRRAAVKLAQVKPADHVLDVACGTGDLAMAFAKAGVQRVTGIDFTYNMLQRAKHKARSAKLSYHGGDAMRLPVASACVDVVSIAFGIRNVGRPDHALSEFYRVLRPGGKLLILEFSMPGNAIMRQLYHFYFMHILPRTASWIARDRTGAYFYLPKSVDTFIDRRAMLNQLDIAGFSKPRVVPLSLGIACIYMATKDC